MRFDPRTGEFIDDDVKRGASPSASKGKPNAASKRSLPSTETPGRTAGKPTSRRSNAVAIVCVLIALNAFRVGTQQREVVLLGIGGVALLAGIILFLRAR